MAWSLCFFALKTIQANTSINIYALRMASCTCFIRQGSIITIHIWCLSIPKHIPSLSRKIHFNQQQQMKFYGCLVGRTWRFISCFQPLLIVFYAMHTSGTYYTNHLWSSYVDGVVAIGSGRQGRERTWRNYLSSCSLKTLTCSLKILSCTPKMAISKFCWTIKLFLK